MTSEQGTESVAPLGPESPVVQGGKLLPAEVVASFSRAITDYVRIEESEKTKRFQIAASITASYIRYSSYLATVMLVIAVGALVLGKDELAEKIIVGVFGFISGFAIGKSAPTVSGDEK